jgi:hypothetical protein
MAYPVIAKHSAPIQPFFSSETQRQTVLAASELKTLRRSK